MDALRAGGFDEHSELTLDLLVIASFDGFFTRVNPAWTRVLGYRQEELLERPFLDFVHPDDREATIAAAAQQTEAGEPVIRFENRYRHKDGSYRWLEWTSRPSERTQQLIAVARDVTERKQLEEAEQQYKQVLEAAVQERTHELEQTNRALEEASGVGVDPFPLTS
jgi:PAS domain S-box-containing protein